MQVELPVVDADDSIQIFGKTIEAMLVRLALIDRHYEVTELKDVSSFTVPGPLYQEDLDLIDEIMVNEVESFNGAQRFERMVRQIQKVTQ